MRNYLANKMKFLRWKLLSLKEECRKLMKKKILPKRLKRKLEKRREMEKEISLDSIVQVEYVMPSMAYMWIIVSGEQISETDFMLYGYSKVLGDWEEDAIHLSMLKEFEENVYTEVFRRKPLKRGNTVRDEIAQIIHIE